VVTAREQSVGGAVRIHGLVSLIEGSKGVAKGNPAWGEMLVQAVCLLEVLPGQVVLLYQEVVRALGERKHKQ